MGHPFEQVGITGYPESHPTINDDLTVQSMWDKRRYATHIVSNLTFDPGAIRELGKRLRGARRDDARCCWACPARWSGPSCWRWPPRSGSASRPGSWSSTRAPSPGWRRPGGFTGERFLEKCAPALGEPGALVEGLHVFTFNQIAETEAWRTDLLARLRR